MEAREMEAYAFLLRENEELRERLKSIERDRDFLCEQVLENSKRYDRQIAAMGRYNETLVRRIRSLVTYTRKMFWHTFSVNDYCTDDSGHTDTVRLNHWWELLGTTRGSTQEENKLFEDCLKMESEELAPKDTVSQLRDYALDLICYIKEEERITGRKVIPESCITRAVELNVLNAGGIVSKKEDQC